MKLTLFVWAAAAASLFAQDRVMSFTASGPVGLETMVGGAIKGQPYSADVVTETVQVLGDGTRITNKSKSFVARDSQGRTRNETPVQVLKAQLAGDAPVKIVMIHDPNAGFTYTLDATNKTARKIAVPTHASSPAMAAKLKAEHDSELRTFTIPDGGQGVVVGTRRTTGAAKTESLGTRVIEGVVAEGTRSTETIPAGSIGNNREIVITNEVWRAQDLKAVVLSKRVDPRMGEMTYQLENIQRSEPSSTLFDVPADYTVIEGAPKHVLTFRRDE